MKKIFSIIAVLFLAAFALSAKGKKDDSKNDDSMKVKGKMSEMRIAYVNVENKKKVTPEGEDKEIEIGALVIYFEFSPLAKKKQIPTIQELRDFYIDGKSYQEYTKEILGRNFEPHTVVYDSATFYKKRPDAKGIIEVQNPKKGLMMATVIYGAPIPEKSKIKMQVKFGWDYDIEDFDFSFGIK